MKVTKTQNLNVYFNLLITKLDEIKNFAFKLQEIAKEQSVESEEKNEEWITLANFYLETRIATPTWLIKLFNKDKTMLRTCTKREGKKFYVKKELLLEHLRKNGKGKILIRTMNYLNNREKKCPEPPAKPLT